MLSECKSLICVRKKIRSTCFHQVNHFVQPLQARKKISDRGTSIGINQAEEVEALRSLVPSWDKQLDQVLNKSLTYPSYYTKPFHAYESGNLCWEAAFQVCHPCELRKFLVIISQ